MGGSRGYKNFIRMRRVLEVSRYKNPVPAERFWLQKYSCTHATPPCPFRFLSGNGGFLHRNCEYVWTFWWMGGRVGTECWGGVWYGKNNWIRSEFFNRTLSEKFWSRLRSRLKTGSGSTGPCVNFFEQTLIENFLPDLGCEMLNRSV